MFTAIIHDYKERYCNEAIIKTLDVHLVTIHTTVSTRHKKGITMYGLPLITRFYVFLQTLYLCLLAVVRKKLCIKLHLT